MTDSAVTPGTVVVALARVMSELGGIDKMTAAERAKRGMGGGDQGIGYAYRGIDQIAAKAQPLLGKHQVVIVPQQVESSVREFTINNRPWTDTYCKITWVICGPGGVDDYITATTEGLGRDNSDKGYNKASTAAFKNLLLRLLCIGDPVDDTDGHAHERDTVRQASPEPRTKAEGTIREMIAAVDDPDVRQRIREGFTAEFGVQLRELDPARHDEALTWVIRQLEDAQWRAEADLAHRDDGS